MLALLTRSARAAARSQAFDQAMRGMATAAAAAPKTSGGDIQLPKAPLQLSGTSANIATLTWQVAAKENQVEKVQDELAQMAELVQTQAELRRLAVDPFLPTIVRKKVIETLMKDSGATEITKRLLEALVDESALAALPQVSAHFDELVLAQKKEVYVTIIAPHQLDKMEKAEIRKQAERFVEPGFKLVAKEKVDKKLLGGFILEFEDRLVDLSAAKKASEFNNLVTKLENDLK